MVVSRALNSRLIFVKPKRKPSKVMILNGKCMLLVLVANIEVKVEKGHGPKRGRRLGKMKVKENQVRANKKGSESGTDEMIIDPKNI